MEDKIAELDRNYNNSTVIIVLLIVAVILIAFLCPMPTLRSIMGIGLIVASVVVLLFRQKLIKERKALLEKEISGISEE